MLHCALAMKHLEGIEQMRVLVAYATMHGSTAGIAEAIGDELRKGGFEVDVRRVDEVRDLAAYGAVILGSAIYIFRWRREALRFGRRHARELQGRPVWLFDSGPLDSSADEGKTTPVKKAVALAGKIRAREHVTFGGRLVPEDAGGMAKRMMESGQAGRYGDHRNFDRIRSWARGIGAQLADASPAQVATPQTPV